MMEFHKEFGAAAKGGGVVVPNNTPLKFLTP
jgi:hypothetical protein